MPRARWGRHLCGCASYLVWLRPEPLTKSQSRVPAGTLFPHLHVLPWPFSSLSYLSFDFSQRIRLSGVGPVDPGMGCLPLAALLSLFPCPEPRHPGFHSGNATFCLLGRRGWGLQLRSLPSQSLSLCVTGRGIRCCARDVSHVGVGWRGRGSCLGTKHDRCLAAAKLHFLLRNAEFRGLFEKKMKKLQTCGVKEFEMNLLIPTFKSSCCRLKDARSFKYSSQSCDDRLALFYELNYSMEGEVNTVTKFMAA